MRWLNNILGALAFLTTLPIPKSLSLSFSPQQMRPYFPMVGLIIGLIVASFDSLITIVFPRDICSWLDVVLFIVLTGGLHLDGLADSADGIFSNKPLDRMLEIMKDSRIGTMGVLALIVFVGIKYFGISNINVNRFFLILLIPAYSRTSMVFAMKSLKYCRKEGTAKGFFNENVKLVEFIPFLFVVIFSFYIPRIGLFLNPIFVLITFVIIYFYKKNIGCITGDTLGAMCEVVESLLFLIISSIS